MGRRPPSHWTWNLDGSFDVTGHLHLLLQMRPLRRDLTLMLGPCPWTMLPFLRVHRGWWEGMAPLGRLGLLLKLRQGMGAASITVPLTAILPENFIFFVFWSQFCQLLYFLRSALPRSLSLVSSSVILHVAQFADFCALLCALNEPIFWCGPSRAKTSGRTKSLDLKIILLMWLQNHTSNLAAISLLTLLKLAVN